MSRLDYLLGIVLVVVALAGAASDLRSRRIPNWLTVSALVAALAMRLAWGEAEALRSGALAAGIGFALAFPLFVARALGGGDVKLLAAICGFLGMERLWTGLAAIAIAGGALALYVAIRRGAVQRTLVLVGRLIRSLVARAALRRHPLPTQTLSTPGALTVPYGVAIAVGAVVGFYW